MSQKRTPRQSFKQLSDLINEIKQCNKLLADALESADSQCMEIRKEIEAEKITEEA